jgi:hypothetical protein
MSITPQNSDSQEIDLSQISKKIGSFFDGISTKVFKAILFFKRNIVWIGILFVIGGVLGYYLDKNTKVYRNQIIVQPNFGSVDYLYSKIQLINSKIEDGDTLFLKNIVGIKHPKKVTKIEIEPINDVYKFIDDNSQNFELIKLMAEDGEIKKILSEDLTSKNYPFHVVTFYTLNQTSDEVSVNPILEFLNKSDYFSKVQKEYVKNVNIKITENDSIIGQINGFLNSFKNTTNGSQKSDKLVYYNENSQLNDVIKTKDALISEQGSLRLQLLSLDKIIKNNSEVLNIKDTNSVNGKMKFILPLIFIIIFVLVGYFKSFYKKQMSKLNS